MKGTNREFYKEITELYKDKELEQIDSILQSTFENSLMS